MKRRILLLFLIALLLTLSVHAAGTVRLEDLGMSVYIPEGYTVITRNMAPDDPGLAIFDMDSESVTKLLEDGNIYLDLMDENDDFEYSITMEPNGQKNMSQFSDDVLDSMVDTLREQYESADFTVREVEHLFNGQAVFFRILVSHEVNGRQIQMLRYHTVHNYQTIIFTAQYWGAEIPEQYRELAENILYSVQFDEPDDYTPSETEETDAESDEAETQAASGPIEQMLAPKPSATTAVTAEPVRKKSSPVLPVILGLIAVAAVAAAVILVRRRGNRTQNPSDAVPDPSKKPGQNRSAANKRKK